MDEGALGQPFFVRVEVRERSLCYERPKQVPLFGYAMTTLDV